MARSTSLLVAFILTTFLISCGSKKAFNYSEMIVKKERSLSTDVVETEDKVEKYIASQNFDSVVVISEKMESKVDKLLQEIKTTSAPDVPEGENFKAAAVRYFQFMKDIYTSYKNYGAATDETRPAELQKMMDVVETKNDVIGDMQKAQKKFAEANGFKLEQ